MTRMSHAMSDSATMLRRKLRHIVRYPSMILMLVGLPFVFLLLFVYVLVLVHRDRPVFLLWAKRLFNRRPAGRAEVFDNRSRRVSGE